MQVIRTPYNSATPQFSDIYMRTHAHTHTLKHTLKHAQTLRLWFAEQQKYYKKLRNTNSSVLF